ncbi:MAG: hypothetical protein Q9167_000095 [Letrouitia subvulpina]
MSPFAFLSASSSETSALRGSLPAPLCSHIIRLLSNVLTEFLHMRMTKNAERSIVIDCQVLNSRVR